MRGAQPKSAKERGQDRVLRAQGFSAKPFLCTLCSGDLLLWLLLYQNAKGWGLECQAFISHSPGG